MILAICVLFCIDCIYPVSAEAIVDDIVNFTTAGKAYKDDPEARKRAREEKREQRRNFKIDKYLEEARELRFEKDFRGARTKAERALRMDEDNRAVKAFLEQLKIEKKRYEEYKARLKERKKAKEKAARDAEKRAGEKAAAERLAEKKARAGEKAAEEAVPQVPGEKAPSAEADAQRIPAGVTAAPGEKEKAEPAPRPSPDEEALPSDIIPDDISMKAGESIVVDGDKVEYFELEGRIVASGNVSVKYGDVKLTCDRIEVNVKDRIALCEGGVKVEHKDGVLTGERIRYDFNNKQGEIIGGKVDAFPFFAEAEETARKGENEYLLKEGFFTTCDLDHPHYRIEARQIRIFPDDKVIAKNVVFRIGDVPVLWLPYYYHPFIDSRAKVQLIPGWDTDWGYFLLSAWRFYLRGNSKVDLLMDYRTRKGPATGADLYYNMSDFGMKGLGSGLFRTYYVFQNGWGTYDPTEFRDDGTDYKTRYRYQWKHRIDFQPGTVGILEFNKMSDENFLKDYLYNEYEETGTEPANYISITSAQSNYLLTMNANKKMNDFYTVTQKLPELKMEIPDQRLGDIPLYYGSEWSGTYFDKDYDNDSIPDEEVKRLHTRQQLSYVLKAGPVNFKPYGEFRETFYMQDRWGDNRARMALAGGISVFSRLHRIYDYDTDFLGLDINDVRHIFAPSVDYYHMHTPTVDSKDLFQMDDIDALEKQNFVSLSMENKLQTKRHTEDGKLETVDLVRLISSVDYHFLMEKKSFTFEDGGDFRDLKFDLELRPYDWMFVQGELEINPRSESVRKINVESTFYPTDAFQMALGYRYEKMDQDPRNQVTFDMDYRLSPKWKIGWYERYDMHDMEIEEQQFRIVRDLHCWELETVLDIDGMNPFNDDFTFWFAFKIKAFPDLPIGLSRSYDKRPPGALNR
jgi:LPS-assembly protein